MALLRLMWHFGIRDGIALWLLPAIENAHKGFYWQEQPDATHETWTGV